jgi:hypothetical protein
LKLPFQVSQLLDFGSLTFNYLILTPQILQLFDFSHQVSKLFDFDPPNLLHFAFVSLHELLCLKNSYVRGILKLKNCFEKDILKFKFFKK